MENFINWGRNTFFEGARKYISLALLAVISLSVLTVYSCEKENLFTEETTEKTVITSLERITAFKQMLASVEAGEMEMRTTYTKSEAIWNIEADINYTYGNPGLKYDQYDIFKDTMSVPAFSGSITASVLAQIYDDVLDIVECHYEGVIFTPKKLKMVDVYEIAGQDALGITSFVGQKSNLNHYRKVFVEGDDWRGTYKKCDLTQAGSGAAPEIAEYATWNLTPLAYDYYLTDVSEIEMFIDYSSLWDSGTWSLDGCDDIIDECDENNPNEHHINSSTYADILCVNWREMNVYLTSVESIIEDVEDDLDLAFQYIGMQWAFTPNQEIYDDWLDETFFGVKNQVINHVPLDLDDCDEP